MKHGAVNLMQLVHRRSVWARSGLGKRLSAPMQQKISKRLLVGGRPFEEGPLRVLNPTAFRPANGPTGALQIRSLQG